MKSVILAGGYGTRISEETHLKPKPMVEIGGKPILWHIMKNYSFFGINDFIICCGYKGYVIKEYFANYFLHMSDITFDMQSNKMQVHQRHAEPWSVTLVDTGENTLTAGRLKRVKDYIDDDQFCFTYGDGLSDVNITELIKFHTLSGKIATVTAVRPPGRYGYLNIDDGRVMDFQEKQEGNISWINGGFFVLERSIFDFIDGDMTSWEQDTLPMLSEKGQLAAYNHKGFWKAMDTIRDKNIMEELWQTGKASWKVWK